LNNSIKYYIFCLFQKRLGITDDFISVGGSSEKNAGAPAAAVAAEPVKVKEAFDIKLTAVDATAKIKIIKEVRAITGLGLKEV
jgi:large subunit ribosomal protein L7/L12